MEVKEAYQILELENGASRAAVEAASRRLLDRWRPDRVASWDPVAVRETERMVHAIDEAYEILIEIAPDIPEPPATSVASKAGPKPTLRPLQAGQPPAGRLTPPPLPPPPEAWAARPAPVPATPPPLTPAAPPASPSQNFLPPPAPLPPVPAPAATAPAPVSAPTPSASVPKPPAAKPTAPADLRSRVAAYYTTLFPLGSPLRPYGLLILVAALAFILLLGKCAFSPSATKSVRERAPDPKTTGSLVVKTNVTNANIEASLIPPPGGVAPDSFTGPVDQALSGLPSGKYAVTVRAAGWPDTRGEVSLEAGRTTEVALNFKSGSLRLDSDPTGATVRLGAAVLGVTPLVVPHLPPGECQLSLKYQSWPVTTFKTTIAEGVESTEAVRLPHGKLTVETTPPGAAVLLGGWAVGQTPLTIENVPAGVRKITLRTKTFPPLEVSVTVEDRGEVKIHPVLGTAFPVLDPAALLRAIWVPDSEDRIAPPIEGVTGPYQSRNGVVKNLNRKFLFKSWLNQRYRFTAIIKSYDAASGQVEFVEQSSELSKYRVVAKLSPESSSDPELAAQLGKGATFSLYGTLSAVEEPRWPSKVITLEISQADPLR